MKINMFVILAAIFTSCSLSDGAHGNVADCPLLSLPVSNECDNGLESQGKCLVEKDIRYNVVGQLPSSNRNAYLLCRVDGGDIALPVVCVYDSAGQFLQSFELLLNGCLSDESSVMENRYTINERLEVYTIEVLSYGTWEAAFVVDSSSVRVRHAALNSKGLFEVDSETSSMTYR